MSLQLDWASHQQAEYAVTRWHYSRVMPAGKSVKIGVWEQGVFKGVIIFSRGANNRLAMHFGLKQTECVELTRIALTDHFYPVTKMVSVALKMLRRQSPGIKLVVSYADTAQGHEGKIYQAGNWVYQGLRHSESAVDPQTNEVKHTRSLHSKYGSIKGFRRVKDKPKHRFIYPLDRSWYVRQKPKSEVTSFQEVEDGAVPTLTLQQKDHT